MMFSQYLPNGLFLFQIRRRNLQEHVWTVVCRTRRGSVQTVRTVEINERDVLVHGKINEVCARFNTGWTCGVIESRPMCEVWCELTLTRMV